MCHVVQCLVPITFMLDQTYFFFLIVHCYKYNYFDRSLGADAIDEEVHIYKAIAALYIEIHQFSHCYISLSFS